MEKQVKIETKQCINSVMLMFLCGGITSKLVLEMTEYLLKQFASDVDILNYVLHNIGLKLRQSDATQMKELLDRISKMAKDFNQTL